MKTSAVILGLVATAASSAIPSEPRDVEVEYAPLPFPIGEAGWVGVLEEGGPVVEVWGSDLLDIEAKVQEEHGTSIFNGTVDVNGTPATPEVAAAFYNEAQKAKRSLEKRQVTDEMILQAPNCFEKWGKVDGFQVNTGVNNLRAVNGGCKVRARQCIRTQCVGEAAIALCNDNYYDLEVSCGHVADLAQAIAHDCIWVDICSDPKQPAHICKTWSAGQNFDGSHNVIVGNCGAVSSSGQPVKA
ncbi:hypothetical protein CNYM01_11035 [Colletotrichum nymphaeae SA-01]|uniref:Secreted protein n=1 Tax=Colletotrichum nymphaeae SA-01 TaxID=1460502 RepID=A0A135TK39_9PEZI|nr:hypothetical protein CNYM01_11035 [Colletotrichum nymphaeae SA-01]